MTRAEAKVCIEAIIGTWEMCQNQKYPSAEDIEIDAEDIAALKIAYKALDPNAIIRTIFGMIHYVCIKNRYCEECPFLRGKCIIYDDSPNEWKMDLINEALKELIEKMEV